MLNQYGLGNLNDWDGNGIDINTNGDYIISPQVAAGSKDNNNTFTGVVMGELKVGSGSSNSAGTGLFGFYQGIESFSLDSATGKLVLGKATGSRIEINPANSNHLLIQSSNYTTANGGAGLKIDLSAPSIEFGSGKFKVTSGGNLTASDANLSGSLNVTGSLSAGSNFSVTSTGALTANNASLSGSLSVTGSLSAGSNFSVNSSGELTAKSGKIGNWMISNGGIYHSNGTYISSSGSIYNNGSNGYSYSLGSGGVFSAYKATITGDITATTGYIGGWKINSDSLSSSDTLNGFNTSIFLNNNGIIDLKGSGTYKKEPGKKNRSTDFD